MRVERIINMGRPKTGFYRNCLYCNKLFYVQRSNTMGKYHKLGIFCSVKCSSTVKGFQKGNQFTGKNERNPNWKGGKVRLTARIRNSNKYKEWRNSVFERDDYTCQICKNPSRGNIESDHIDPIGFFTRFYNLRNLDEAFECPYIWDINNGRTLCIDCHKTTETWGSKFFKYYKNL